MMSMTRCCPTYRLRQFATLMLGFCLVTLAAGCGFTPLYGHSDAPGVQTALSQVQISNTPDRSGQALRNRLIDKFYTNGWPERPLYRLTVSPVRESIRDLDITKSSDATRGQLRLYTDITLRDNQTGEVLLRRPLTAITSFNILQSRFTTRVSEQDARKNALYDLADQIETRLSLYFDRRAEPDVIATQALQGLAAPITSP